MKKLVCLCLAYLMIQWCVFGVADGQQPEDQKEPETIQIKRNTWIYALDAVMLQDGSVLLAGSTGGSTLEVASLAYVLKIDSSGEQVFMLEYSIDGMNASFSDIIPQTNGTALLRSRGVKNGGLMREELVSISSQGELLWQHETHSSLYGHFEAQGDGAVAISNHLVSEETYSQAPRVALLDSSGELVWENVYESMADCRVDHAYMVDDGFLVVGHIWPTDSVRHSFVAMLDMDGNVVNETFVHGKIGTFFEDSIMTQDNGILVIGYEPQERGVSVFLSKAWRFDANGNMLYEAEHGHLSSAYYRRLAEVDGAHYIFHNENLSSIILWKLKDDGSIDVTKKIPVPNGLAGTLPEIVSNGDKAYLVYEENMENHTAYETSIKLIDMSDIQFSQDSIMGK